MQTSSTNHPTTTLHHHKYDQQLQVAKEAAKLAGDLILQSSRQQQQQEEFRITSKSNNVDLVTNVDTECERIITNHIRQHFPDDIIIGEEDCSSSSSSSTETATRHNSGDVDVVVGQPIPTSRPVWLIDPVDGTTNFVHGHPFVAVSIGYCVHGIPTVGVIFNPFLKELYHAQQGGGSYCNDSPISVDLNATRLGDCLLVNNIGHTRSAAFVTESTQRIAAWLQGGLRGYRSSGCAAMNMAHVASGTVSAFYEHGCGGPWDVAAGMVLVQEAGGVVLEAAVAANSDPPPHHCLVIGKGSMCAAGTMELAQEVIQTAGIPSVKFHGFRISE
eukprot:scaffold609_cov170-Amphora_coffeaeformis.AAC.22